MKNCIVEMYMNTLLGIISHKNRNIIEQMMENCGRLVIFHGKESKEFAERLSALEYLQKKIEYCRSIGILGEYYMCYKIEKQKKNRTKTCKRIKRYS